MTDGKIRILYLPILFYPEPWNGIMERMRLVIQALPFEEFEPIIAVRTEDGEQTVTLAERTGAKTVHSPDHPSRKQLSRLCESERIDIVHINTPTTGGVPRAALAALRGGVGATVVTYHQAQVGRLPWKTRLVNYLAHLAFVDEIVAGSKGIADTLVDCCGLRARDINVILYGVEQARGACSSREPLLQRSPEEVWIGYFGRLAKEKGLTFLLRAMAALGVACPQARLVLVGDGYERAALEAEVRQLGLAGKVIFAGHRRDVRSCMSEVDIVVLPSLVEGLGLVLLEAMSVARPVVATRAPGGIPEVVRDGVTGLLVPPADAEALAQALRTLLEDPQLRKSLGARGRERFSECFQSNRMVRDEHAVYRRVRHARGPSGWKNSPIILARLLHNATRQIRASWNGSSRRKALLRLSWRTGSN